MQEGLAALDGYAQIFSRHVSLSGRVPQISVITGTSAGGSTTWLYLMNSGTMAASVEVTVLTDSGLQSGQDNEVTVPPHRYLSVNLASQAQGSTALAVHVQTSSGQVAADMWQAGGSGGCEVSRS